MYLQKVYAEKRIHTEMSWIQNTTLVSVCVEVCPRRRPDGQDEEDAGAHCALHLPGTRRPPHQPLHRCTGLRSCAAPTSSAIYFSVLPLYDIPLCLFKIQIDGHLPVSAAFLETF
jgi:hypothetical protein